MKRELETHGLRLDNFWIVWVAGDRYWNPWDQMEHELSLVMRRHEKVLVISGGAPGVDTVCRMVCLKRGYLFAEIPAAWDYWKKKAGPIRNSYMLLFKPNKLLAFHQNLEASSTGTKDAVAKAKRAKISVKKITK